MGRSPEKFLKELMDVCARGVRAYSHSLRTPEDNAGQEAKVPTYRRQCREVWLLIVARGFEPSTHVDIGSEVESYRYESGFDRVFFLHHANEYVAELHVRLAS